MPRNKNLVPTRPIGQPGGLQPTWSTVAGPGWEATGWEQNPDLRFPQSVWVFDRMRRTESQIGGVFRAVTLPIRSATWTLNTDNVDPAIAAFVADQINLDGGIHRTGGINFPEHTREALLGTVWGFAPFELVYDIGPGRTPGAPALCAHLKRLALRPPVTLTEVRSTLDGDLDGIAQMPPGYDTPGGNVVIGVGRGAATTPEDVWIPANRLLFYCFEREGADWHGTSLLRTAYKDWFLKEQSLIKASQAIERQSMGVPVTEYDDPVDREAALQISTNLRSGASAGVALPPGIRLRIEGVTGTLIDPLPLIKYHDQQMGKASLAMFLDLGHDNGARSLADTFVDYFAMSLNSVADWLAVTFTQQVIRPLVDLNFGPGHDIPVLACEEITAGNSATAEALGILVDAGIITADQALEQQTRRAYGLVEREDTTDGVPPVDPMHSPGPEPMNPAPGAEPPTLGDTLTRMSALVERMAELTEGR